MSEKIKITIVTHDEKPNIKRAGKAGRSIILTQDSSMTLMSILLEKRLIDGNFCGGRGDCGRCVVQFLVGAPLPTGVERAQLTPEELRHGYRLACMTRPKTDCVVRIIEAEETEPEIVTEVNLPSENIDLNSRKKCLTENQKATAMKSGTKQEKSSKNNTSYIVAVDLGTTTIAMQLCDGESGETAAIYCERNPQRIYGSDVLARIQAFCEGNGEELRRLVCETLLRGLGQFAVCFRKGEAVDGSADEMDTAYGLEKIACMCIAGNTAMQHLLLGYDVETLGKAPFVPTKTGLQTIMASCFFPEKVMENRESRALTGYFAAGMDFPVYIAPCISAFVGGDIVAGLYALHMLPTFAEQATAFCNAGEKEGTKRAVLLIDLGTNGEMAITDGERMIATATAAGPAFEGDGILVGTDRIAFTAELLRRGILDETGLLAEPYFTEGVPFVTEENARTADNKIKSACYFKQKDVRTLQMAKAAVRAGVEILWEEMGQPEIEQIYLSGGFGYYLDVEAALAIGLLPVRMRGRVRATGNTSLAGAYELGRSLCRGELKTETLEEKLSSIISVNLAQKESFEGLYLKYMNLEEN